MNAPTNVEARKTIRTNKTSTTVIIALAALVLGLFFGAAAAKTGTGLWSLTQKPNATASQMPSTAANNQKPGGLKS
ncbi:MAG TPA: hypothetical protein VIK53_04145 [Verrucomicrobiae bacterium]